MNYELLFQPLEPGAPWDSAALEERLRAAGAVESSAGGGWTWVRPGGEVTLQPVVEGGAQRALAIRVPLTDKTGLLSDVLAVCAGLAAESGLRLVDPQLSKAVTGADEGRVTETYLRTARYAGDYVGVAAAVPTGDPAQDVGKLKPGTKLLLGLVGLCIIVYLLAEQLLG